MRTKISLDDQRLWIVVNALSLDASPPYRDDLEVTPGCFFGDHGWYFPLENLTPGRRKKNGIDFLTAANLANTVGRLIPGSLLLLQLKDVGVVHVFRLDVLKSRINVSNGGFFTERMTSIKRFFIAMKIIGLNSLSDLTPFNLPQVRALMSTTKADNFGFILSQLILISQAGLVRDGLRAYEWEIDVDDDDGEDTTSERGTQPLTAEEAGTLLKLSRTYISLSSEISSEIRALSDPISPQAAISNGLKAKLPANLQDLDAQWHSTTLHLLVEVSSANLGCYHFGFRPSELLSIRKGFIVTILDDPDDQDLRIKFIRTKNVSTPTSRELRVDPYLREVEAAIEDVRDALNAQSDFIYSHPNSEWEMSYNRYLYRLKRFCQLHGLDFNLTGYTWRKTVVDIMVRVITEAIPILQHILGHVSETESVGYALSSPLLQPEIQAGVMQVYTRRAGTLFETATSSVTELGGLAGKRLQKLLSSDINSEDLGMTKEEFVEDCIAEGNFPIKVAEGVYCVRGKLGRGLCSIDSGDLLADPANCSAACNFQVQMPERRDVVKENMANLGKLLSSDTVPRMQKVHAVNQVNEQLVAWPELVEFREELLKLDPQLIKWFKNGVKGHSRKSTRIETP